MSFLLTDRNHYPEMAERRTWMNSVRNALGKKNNQNFHKEPRTDGKGNICKKGAVYRLLTEEPGKKLTTSKKTTATVDPFLRPTISKHCSHSERFYIG
jgi:hypothetical protein